MSEDLHRIRELRAWQSLLLNDFSSQEENSDTGVDILNDARRRSDLLNRSTWDRNAVDKVNALCPHWPPLRLKSDLENAVMEVVATSEHQAVDPDSVYRACMGLDPDLPWDLFFHDPCSIPSAIRSEMQWQRSTSLLTFCLQARISSERILLGTWSADTEEDTIMASAWLAAKAKFNGSSLSLPELGELCSVLQEEMDRVGRQIPLISLPHSTPSRSQPRLRILTLLPQPALDLGMPLGPTTARGTDIRGSEPTLLLPEPPTSPGDPVLSTLPNFAGQSCSMPSSGADTFTGPSASDGTDVTRSPAQRTRRGGRGKRTLSAASPGGPSSAQ
jgi:hypothetical protein